jgi:hypothetical protein
MIVGVGSSLLIMLKTESRPTHAVLGRLSGTEVYRNLSRYSSAREIEGVLIFRFDAALHFANKSYFKSLLQKYVHERSLSTEMSHPGEPPVTELPCSRIRLIVLDMYGVHDIDSTAFVMFKKLLLDFSEADIEVVIAGCKGPVRDMLIKGAVISSALLTSSGDRSNQQYCPSPLQPAPRKFEALKPGASWEMLSAGSSASVTDSSWEEAVMQVAESDTSLCQQFVTLKTAVRFAQWRVRTLEDEEEARGDVPMQQSMWAQVDQTDSPLTAALSSALSPSTTSRTGGAGLLLRGVSGEDDAAPTQWQRFVRNFQGEIN